MKIKATELRVGNKVQPKPEDRQRYGTMCEVTQVYKDGFTVDYHYPGAWFEPIPLSPDILEKAGFKRFGRIQDGYWFELRRNNFTLITNDSLFSDKRWQIGISGKGEADTIWICHCKHIHQLQNLIHDLTRKDLNINL
jgi:hypothetical protein